MPNLSQNKNEAMFTVEFSCYVFGLFMITINKSKTKHKNNVWGKRLGLPVTVLATALGLGICF